MTLLEAQTLQIPRIPNNQFEAIIQGPVLLSLFQNLIETIPVLVYYRQYQPVSYNTQLYTTNSSNSTFFFVWTRIQTKQRIRILCPHQITSITKPQSSRPYLVYPCLHCILSDNLIVSLRQYPCYFPRDVPCGQGWEDPAWPPPYAFNKRVQLCFDTCHYQRRRSLGK